MARSLLAVLCMLGPLVAAAEDRPYTEGGVIEVTSIRTKPGMFDAYMKWVATERKQEMEEFKKAGIITAYSVYTMPPRTPNDPDIILVVEYKNMGALDNLDDRTDAIDKKIFGSLDQANRGAIDREKMRTVLGTEYMRELKLK
jgi:hypothetical protein